MKQILITLLLTLTALTAGAQDNPWEQAKAKTENYDPRTDPRYLAGAVPEVDGRVQWEVNIAVPGKTRAQLYDTTLNLMKALTKEKGQMEQSRIALEDKEKGQVMGSYQEWLTFKNTALVLDRTRLLYNLVAECTDGNVNLKMTRIIYIYDEERQPQTYRAEEWINDQYGLTRNQKKLARVSGKFRRKTIDRKDYLFSKFEEFLKK